MQILISKVAIPYEDQLSERETIFALHLYLYYKYDYDYTIFIFVSLVHVSS